MKKWVALFMIALLIRLFFVFLWYHTGNGDRISADSTGYYPIGQSIVEGNGFRFEGQAFTRRAPLYCLFVGLISKFAPFPMAIYLIQSLIGAVSCLILLHLAWNMFGESAAFCAAAFSAVDYATLRFTVEVMPENLFVLFLLLGFYFAVRGRLFDSIKNLIWGGFFFALAALTKDGIIYFIPLMALSFLVMKGPGKKKVLAGGVFFAAFIVVISPWVVRNSMLTKHFSLITTSGGHVFYLGNNPSTVGNPTGGEWRYGLDYNYPQDDPNLPPLYTWEADRYLSKKAIEFIRHNPARFCQLIKTKVFNMWRPYQADSPRLAKWAMLLTYVPVMLLGMLGLIFSIPRWKEFIFFYGFIGYFFLVHIVLFGQIRFRYPVMPLIMIFAGFGIVTVCSKFNARQVNARDINQ